MRLIDADNAIHALGVFSDMEHGNKHFLNGINSAKEIINECVTIDAVPVVRGEWIRMDETQALLSVEWKCSQCGQEIRVDGILTAIGAGWKYCPNCGAKMDKEAANETNSI